VTRLSVNGLAIAVTCDADGMPVRLTWGGAAHPVTAVIERWRVDAEWWRGRVWRMYFRLTTDTGLLLEVYHDLLADGWFIQRVYD
jgi:hypothetical protein